MAPKPNSVANAVAQLLPRAGETVSLVGLSRADLNGQQGVVLLQDPETGRIGVRVKGRTLAVQPKNLRLEDEHDVKVRLALGIRTDSVSATLAVCDRVHLHMLAGGDELLGVCISFLSLSDLGTAKQVCRAWCRTARRVARTDSDWVRRVAETEGLETLLLAGAPNRGLLAALEDRRKLGTELMIEMLCEDYDFSAARRLPSNLVAAIDKALAGGRKHSDELREAMFECAPAWWMPRHALRQFGPSLTKRSLGRSASLPEAVIFLQEEDADGKQKQTTCKTVRLDAYNFASLSHFLQPPDDREHMNICRAVGIVTPCEGVLSGRPVPAGSVSAVLWTRHEQYVWVRMPAADRMKQMCFEIQMSDLREHRNLEVMQLR